MQEEISEKSMAFAARIGEVTYQELQKAVEKLLAELKKDKGKAPAADKNAADKKPEQKHGKQTLKQLSKQNDGLSTVELKDPNLRLLKQTMKKHGVDFAAVKDGKGKYTLFFKGKDADSLTHAFKQYTQKVVKVANVKPSINKALTAAKAAAQALNAGRDKVKNRDKGAIDR
jgi:hypothetical protein